MEDKNRRFLHRVIYFLGLQAICFLALYVLVDQDASKDAVYWWIIGWGSTLHLPLFWAFRS